MEIIAESVEVTGPHGPLLQPTSLRVRDGQLLLVTGDPDSGRTALALTLSGRLRPSRGTVRRDGSTDANALRRTVAIVDAPQITEPEGSVPVTDVVAEGLSFARRRSGRRAVRAWLAEHHLDQFSAERFEHLPSTARTELLVELAAAGRDVETLILDCPDRHGGDPLGWYSLAARHAERGLAVVVLCAPYSAEKLGVSHSRVGPANSSQQSTMEHTEGTR